MENQPKRSLNATQSILAVGVIFCVLKSSYTIYYNQLVRGIYFTLFSH